MKIPLLVKWFLHVVKGEWKSMDDDSKFGCGVFYAIIAIADWAVLLFCNNQWTRESGYGWTQGAFNWGMVFFWLTGLPFALVVLYFVLKSIHYLYQSARDSYAKYKRDNL